MIGDIDSTIPSGITHLVERKSEVFQQHNGVVTAVQYDKLEEMPLEQFIKDIVPTLGEENVGKLTVIKDPVRQMMYRILNDNVAIYHITNIQDVFLDTFLDNLMSERPLSITPNLTYPLIGYATTKNGEKIITVAIPHKQFTYHPAGDGMKPFVVWHPPLWLRCKLSPANVPTDVKIGVVLDRTDDVGDTVVYHLPLPNCYPDGNICFGGTHLSNPNPNKPLTEAIAIELTYQRLFNSAFNLDLVSSKESSAFLTLCQTLPDYAEFKPQVAGGGYKAYVNSIMYGWRDQSSIWKYAYQKISDGRRFIDR